MKQQQTMHRAKAISVWGTSSDAGKSLFCTGLGRLLSNKGYKIAPFKAQNMSNNSAVTIEGGEIGRAQACQAEACRVPIINDLNPLLLKPSGDMKSQVVLQGTMSGSIGPDFGSNRLNEFKHTIAESYDRLASKYDLILIEGAGGCAELNLRHRDLANEWIANYADAKVILIADIERGGVFASLLGTIDLLPPSSRARVMGLIINKFHGASELFVEGKRILEERSGLPVLGVIPYIPNHHLPDEDGASFQNRTLHTGKNNQTKKVRVGVVMTPYISNSTDIEALIADERFDVDLLYQPAAKEIDLFVIPGSKNVIEDLVHLKNRGFARYLTEQRTAGKMIIGICGGYQMLGTVVQDPHHVESDAGACEGLGFLDVTTVILPKKTTKNVEGTFLPGGFGITGYEIHCGETVSALLPSLIEIQQEQTVSCNRYDGAISEDGLVWGTYIHGILDSFHFRNYIAQQFGIFGSQPEPIRDIYQELASKISTHIDVEYIIRRISS